MTLPRVIAICGKRRAGKDTVADILCETFAYRKVRIADPLKKMMQVLFGFTEEQLECDVKDKVDDRWDISPRQAMQFFGTDVMQYKIQELLPSVGRTFWIRSLIERELRNANPTTLIVIPDVRFLHEIQELEPFQPWILRVSRPCHDVNTTDAHASEMEGDRILCDAHIKNDGDIESLRKHIYDIIRNRIQSSHRNASKAREDEGSRMPQ